MSRTFARPFPAPDYISKLVSYLIFSFALIALVSPLSHAARLDITADTQWPVEGSQQARVLFEEGRPLRFDEFAAFHEGPIPGFVPLTHEAATGSTQAARWLLLDVAASPDHAVSLVLSPGSNNAGRIDYHVWRQGAWSQHTTGDAVSLTAPRSYDRIHGLAFKLKAGEHARILARLESARPLHLKPKLHLSEEFEAHERRKALWDGVLFGGLLLLAWGGLMIALLTQNPHFGVMAALSLSTALYEASVRGYGKLYLWPESVLWASRSTSTFGLGCMTLFLVFVLGIAHRERLHLPCRKPLTVLAFITFLMIGMVWTGLQAQAMAMVPFVVVAHTVTIFITAALLLKNGTPGGRVILSIGVFVLAHAVLRLLTWNNLLPSFVSSAGVDDPTTDPVIALLGLCLNVSILCVWIIEVGRQRGQARDELMAMKQKEGERLKEQVALQTDALNRSLQYAHEENRRKTETLSYIGHDLRAPLATIVGHARMLSGKGGTQLQEHIRAIERSADFQLSLIDEILDYSKHALKPLDVQLRPTGLKELLDDVLRQARDLSQQQGNRFECAALTPLPAWVQSDGKRLQQTLLNLISNAAKFTRRGTIRLTVDADLTAAAGALTFCISDSGRGIALDQQSRLFNAFEQGEPRQGSAGLGLHIAQRIVMNLGGKLDLRSRPGIGSEFSFTVPAKRLSDEVFELPMISSPGPGAHALEAQARPGTQEPLVQAPPVELRVDLAKYARDGQLSDIEAWLAGQIRRYPEYASYISRIEQALQELDFERIEAMALEGVG